MGPCFLIHILLLCLQETVCFVKGQNHEMCSNYSHMGKYSFHLKGNGFNFDEEAPESETLLEILKK